MEEGNFGWALGRLNDEKFVARKGWNGKHRIKIHYPNLKDQTLEPSTVPYIYICTEQGDRLPWVASQADILAIDWEEA